MQYISRLTVWLWRAWPVILLLGAISLHMIALSAFADRGTFVNKLTGTFLQVAGGVIVLLSLDGNLGLFKQQTLLAALILWVKEFPRGNHRTISLGVGMATGLNMAASLTVGRRTPTTLEERVAQLEQRITEESERLRSFERSTAELLAAVRSELRQSIAAVDTGLRELTTKVERSAIGGLKQQLFGVLLAVYGAIVSVFA